MFCKKTKNKTRSGARLSHEAWENETESEGTREKDRPGWVYSFSYSSGMGGKRKNIEGKSVGDKQHKLTAGDKKQGERGVLRGKREYHGGKKRGEAIRAS